MKDRMTAFVKLKGESFLVMISLELIQLTEYSDTLSWELRWAQLFDERRYPLSLPLPDNAPRRCDVIFTRRASRS